MTIIPLAPPSLAGSSNRPGSIGRAVLPPYLALLRAGFCLPPMLPPARCALTAPFHPYPPPLAAGFRRQRATAGKPSQACPTQRVSAKSGGVFSVPLSFGSPRPAVNRRTALRSSDFPPSAFALTAPADGDRLALCGNLLL